MATPATELKWCEEYRQRPYLKEATVDELCARGRDLMCNIVTLTPEGRFGPSLAEGFRRWHVLLVHTIEELRSRGAMPPGCLKDAKVPTPTYPTPPKAVKVLKDVTLPQEGTYWVKFGEVRYMAELYDLGRLKISPAADYDRSLIHAIRDDELKLERATLRSKLKVTSFDGETGVPKQTVESVEIRVTTRSVTNYFVYCLSRVLDIRLFDDFEYDACVIIRNPEDFTRRLRAAAAQHFNGWAAMDQPITYVDPYTSNPYASDVFFGKHFRFWYQQEHRFAWGPPRSYAGPFEPIFLEIGSLEGDAELVMLEP